MAFSSNKITSLRASANHRATSKLFEIFILEEVQLLKNLIRGLLGCSQRQFFPKNGPDFEVEFGLEVTVLAVIVLLYNKFQVFFTLYLSDADQDKTISFIWICKIFAIQILCLIIQLFYPISRSKRIGIWVSMIRAFFKMVAFFSGKSLRKIFSHVLKNGFDPAKITITNQINSNCIEIRMWHLERTIIWLSPKSDPKRTKRTLSCIYQRMVYFLHWKRRSLVPWLTVLESDFESGFFYKKIFFEKWLICNKTLANLYLN